MKEAIASKAKISAESEVISLADVINQLFGAADIDTSNLPAIKLKALNTDLDKPDEKHATATLEIDKTYTGSFEIAGKKVQNAWQFVAYASLTADPLIDFGKDLPLIGPELKGKLILTSGDLLVTTRNPDGIDLSKLKAKDITPGIAFDFEFKIDGETKKVNLPVVKYAAAEKPASGSFKKIIIREDQGNGGNGDGDGKGSDDGTESKTPAEAPVQKKVGPVLIDSLELSFSNQRLTVRISGNIAVGPVKVSLDGLSISASLEDFSPTFDLEGLGFSLHTTDLTIDGSILRMAADQLPSGVAIQFDGGLVVELGKFGLAAFASYAGLNTGEVSCFIFVSVNAPLGGPPFFQINGVMGGFGFNRHLELPEYSELSDFPLLSIGKEQGGSDKVTAAQIIAELEGKGGGDAKAWVTVKPNDYWMALGCKFSSFEIIEGELLISVAMGGDLQFGLLGMASLTFPKGATADKAFVFVELQLAIVFKPEDGYLAVQGGLTNNSFVLTKACQLSGEFAFYMWYGKNTNAGQFVVSVGGYHPAFKAPAYYPTVARLGYNWKVSSKVSVKGEAYFAMTPSCAMGGGKLEALYQLGPIKAWFNAEADFLLTWHPFSFTAQISIEIGASVHVHVLFVSATVKVSLGASLKMWGPPTGGKVRVHVVIADVDISFGSSDALDKNNQPLSWTDFKSLLPDLDNTCKIVAEAGLTSILKKNAAGTILFNERDGGSGNTDLWVVRAGSFQFSTQSVIPSSNISCSNGNGADHEEGGDSINIRPMNLQGLSVTMKIQICQDSVDGRLIDTSAWVFEANRTDMAVTLWGVPLYQDNGQFMQAPTTPSADVVAKQLTGYSIKAPDPAIGDSFGKVEMKNLSFEYIRPPVGTPQNPLNTHKPTNNDYLPSQSKTTIADLQQITSSNVASNRNNMYDLLNSLGIYTGSNDTMNGMAVYASSLFDSDPLEQL